MPATVLLADLPRMLEDMVASVLQSDPNIYVVSGAANDRGPVAAATDAGAQVVFVTRRDPADLASVDAQIAQAAAVSIFALSPDGAWACLYTLKPYVTRLDDLSSAKVLAALASMTHFGRA